MSNLGQHWRNTKKIVVKGYEILEKEFSLNIPAPCLPPASVEEDTGIGSPVSKGAEKFFDFFEGVFDKILLGPMGRSFPPTYSPYESTYGQNPLFIDLEKLTTNEYSAILSKNTFEKICSIKKNPIDICYAKVSRDYNDALFEAWLNFEKKLIEQDEFAVEINEKMKIFAKDVLIAGDAKFYTPFAQRRYLFEEAIAWKMQADNGRKYIADLEIKLPDCLVANKPEWFLKDFTLGSPADGFSDSDRNWNFKVLNPDYIFNNDGTLGDAGKFLFDVFDRMFATYKGGVRIDHFIGLVNPFVFALDKQDISGRLYSSYDNHKLKKYAKYSVDEFASIVEKILIAAAHKNGKNAKDIYAEDLGARPEQLDPVMKKLGIGRMVLPQFANVDDEKHMYLLANINENDVAVSDTHDTMSIRDFYIKSDDALRKKHALKMCHNLRFNYNGSLANPKELLRMHWGEMMWCKATRVQAFFTSVIGQDGRYNEPGNPKKWRLRCSSDFEKMYFANLLNGMAYNPLDAIALAIYARGDDFYNKHKKLVEELRQQEIKLKEAIYEKY
ncbi:MAG: 4-alpha-glucanotransferase [Alphaproteobacteria bacterium]|nr:4-alpha-glucanotransferase [Alphaproteobacteria bacterium]